MAFTFPPEKLTTDDRRPTTDDRRPTTDDRRPTTVIVVGLDFIVYAVISCGAACLGCRR
jgi:hypothetical protein